MPHIAFLVSGLTVLCFLCSITVESIAIDWEKVSIDLIQQGIRNGTTCESIIRAFLDRVERFDSGLGGLILINYAALNKARELDKYFSDTGRFIGNHQAAISILFLFLGLDTLLKNVENIDFNERISNGL